MPHRARLLSALLLLPACWAGAQIPDPSTDFQITGDVYEPQAVAPTAEHIARLALPTGFRIDRYAEGLYNPRMLAVDADGTVYVTQRAPGQLVTLNLKSMHGHVLAKGGLVGKFAKAP